MGREVRLRAAAIKGMEKVHEGCCGYPASGAGGKLARPIEARKAVTSSCSKHHVPPAGVALHPIWEKGLYKEITITGAKDLLPGDWVYFKNRSDYADKHPGGNWSSEHTMYLGNGKFRGFGTDPDRTEDQLNKKLLEEYNSGLPAADRKASVPGMQNYARRPVISEVEKTGP